MTRLPASLLVLALAALVAAGCGGPPELADVEKCLKEQDLIVERPKDTADTGVTAGISARSKPEERTLTMALAAEARSDKDVDDFHDTFEETKDGLNEQQADAFEFDSGSDGRYVWAVAGSKDSKAYDAALECVEA